MKKKRIKNQKMINSKVFIKLIFLYSCFIILSCSSDQEKSKVIVNDKNLKKNIFIVDTFEMKNPVYVLFFDTVSVHQGVVDLDYGRVIMEYSYLKNLEQDLTFQRCLKEHQGSYYMYVGEDELNMTLSSEIQNNSNSYTGEVLLEFKGLKNNIQQYNKNYNFKVNRDSLSPRTLYWKSSKIDCNKFLRFKISSSVFNDFGSIDDIRIDTLNVEYVNAVTNVGVSK